jgi:hypothetical protein
MRREQAGRGYEDRPAEQARRIELEGRQDQPTGGTDQPCERAEIVGVDEPACIRTIGGRKRLVDRDEIGQLVRAR